MNEVSDPLFTASDQAVTRDILRVLCRLPVRRGQLVLYHFAAAARQKGFTSDQVKAQLNFDQAQHRGLMSALAGRINETPRETSTTKKPGVSLMFRQKWEGQQYTYWPRSELLEAIRRLPALAALVQRPVDEVLASPRLELVLPENVPAQPPAEPPRFAGPAIPPGAFRGFLANLDAQGLVFPADVIANLLLALQVKRFVILTGISGTGKTRIGQALAARFRGTHRVAVEPDLDGRAALVQVHPYMVKRNRMVLPMSISSQIDGVKGPGRIQGRWPKGEMELVTYRGNRTLSVLFKGSFRAWFTETLPEGTPFVVRLEDAADGKSSVLVFEPPGKVKEVPVENSEVIAVRPDWTDHRGLLGHYNPLTEDYVSTPFLRLMLRAADESHRAQAEKRSPIPFFALLDEMNLARVEHYFVDFLSALESGEALHLHDVPEIEEGQTEEGGMPVPRRLHVPPNLFFIGTVNVDETTHFFSPKVLDRAFAIELDQVNLNELAAATAPIGDLELSRWSGALPPPGRLAREDWQWLSTYQGGEPADAVKTIHALLARSHRHFGYRVVEEMARFIRLATTQVAETDAEVAAWVALDLAISQKVLVKLNGTQAELEEPLRALLAFVLTGEDEEAKPLDLAPWTLDPSGGKVVAKDKSTDIAPLLPRSAAKLWRMRDRLHRQGFTAWIE